MHDAVASAADQDDDEIFEEEEAAVNRVGVDVAEFVIRVRLRGGGEASCSAVVAVAAVDASATSEPSKFAAVRLRTREEREGLCDCTGAEETDVGASTIDARALPPPDCGRWSSWSETTGSGRGADADTVDDADGDVVVDGCSCAGETEPDVVMMTSS